MEEWVRQGGAASETRILVVFVDDLDRCSPTVIARTLEAIKLYLAVPGLIFVVGCDQNIVSAGLEEAHGLHGQSGRNYLEKIVQVGYVVGPPTRQQGARLIRTYARESGTWDLIDKGLASVMLERSGGNPRRVKRLINGFILRHGLDGRQLAEDTDAARQLLRSLILQMLYPEFHDLLSRRPEPDPAAELLEYLVARDALRRRLPSHHQQWEAVRHFFEDHHLAPPDADDAASFTDALGRV